MHREGGDSFSELLNRFLAIGAGLKKDDVEGSGKEVADALGARVDDRMMFFPVVTAHELGYLPSGYDFLIFDDVGEWASEGSRAVSADTMVSAGLQAVQIRRTSCHPINGSFMSRIDQRLLTTVQSFAALDYGGVLRLEKNRAGDVGEVGNVSLNRIF